MKTCFKCRETKHIDEFFSHSQMSDGHLGKCKSCARRDANEHREKAIAKITEYEKQRFRDPKRKAKILQYQRTRRKRHPQKNLARQMVRRAVASGKLKRSPCVHCGNPKTQAHHDDYNRPLDVRWVCFKCHREIEHGQKIRSA